MNKKLSYLLTTFHTYLTPTAVSLHAVGTVFLVQYGADAGHPYMVVIGLVFALAHLYSFIAWVFEMPRNLKEIEQQEEIQKKAMAMFEKQLKKAEKEEK